MRPSGLSSKWCFLALAAATAPGCIRNASGPNGDLSKPSTPSAVFPAPSELAPLPTLPPPPEAFALGAVPVDRWTVEASMPPSDERSRYDDPSPWGELARAFSAAHSGKVRLSSSLRCAAFEMARFYAREHGIPTESLRRFLVARCGATTPDTTSSVYGGDANEAISDEELFERSKDGVQKFLTRQLSAGSDLQVVGVAAYRADGHFAVAILSGPELAVFEPLPRSIDASRHVSLRGTLKVSAAEAMAVVNRGDYGFDACAPDPTAHLPSFAFACALSEQDHSAWAQIVVRQNGRVLEEPVADLLIDDASAPQPEYRVRPSSAAAKSGGPDIRKELLDGINAVRAEGGLTPLALEGRQSESNGRLVGTLLDASFRHRGAQADRIALGMLAGWDVGATIRNGGIFLGVVPARADAGAWVDFAIERPLGRLVVLDPSARRIAIAPAVQADGKGLGAAVTTYSLFDTADPVADTAHVVDRIATLRRARGHKPLGRLAAPALDEQSRRVLSGAVEPGAALYASMQAVAAQAVAGRVHGYLVEGNDVDQMPVPDEILDLPGGALAVCVTHHRVRGAAWGQYVIFYVVLTDASGTGSVET